MSQSERAPLLAAEAEAQPSPLVSEETTSESTPLLSSNTTLRYDGEDDTPRGDDAVSVRSQGSASSSTKASKKGSRRWPSIIAILILALLSIGIIVAAFIVPDAVEEYAKQAAVLEPTNLKLESLTSDGVRARIQANFRLDGSRVKNDQVRTVGRAVTWIVRQLGTESTSISVYLPEYGNVLLGTAAVPPLVINIADGENTAIDFVADLFPGDTDGIRTIVNEWLEGRLGTLRVQGKADLAVKSGIIPLGTHSVSESLTIEAHKLPQLPEYNITDLVFREKPIPGESKQAMAADVSITAYNKYPVSLEVPELGFQILVPGCTVNDSYIVVADAATSPIVVRPQSSVVAEVHGLITDLPEPFTSACPDTGSSPLDVFLKKFLDGKAATVFVRGRRMPDSSTPNWLEELISSVTVPVPFPKRSFDSLIRNFSLTDTHFTMPDSFAEPGDPDADPKVSGTIKVLAALPSEMNFALDVTDVRARANVSYGGRKLGELNLQKWQPANSTRLNATIGDEALLSIQSTVKDVPLNVTDGDVLTDVIQALIFKHQKVLLDIKANVDVKVQTVLGQLVLKNVPAQGRFPLKPIGNSSIGDTISGLNPQVGSIQILDTTPSSVKLQALVNITNPTPYTAHIPFVSIHVLCNGSLLAEATAENVDVTTGNNTNLVVSATWNPSLGGEVGKIVGRNLLSQYLSGFNTSITVRTHRGTIPAVPQIGEGLSRLNLTVPTPRLRLPGGEDGERGRFIRDATFHVFSSTAQFTLVNPLPRNTIFIDRVNATALYNHTEPMGRIEYDLPFAATPGASTTPRLPVDWSLDSVGYGKMREALGGRLKLDAQAVVDVRLGAWTETVWFIGKGIGASVKI